MAVARNQSGVIEAYQEGVPGAEVRLHDSGTLRRRGHLQKVNTDDNNSSNEEDEVNSASREEDEAEESHQDRQPAEREKRTRKGNVRLREWDQNTRDNGPVTFQSQHCEQDVNGAVIEEVWTAYQAKGGEQPRPTEEVQVDEETFQAAWQCYRATTEEKEHLMDYLDPDCPLEHEQDCRTIRYWEERYDSLQRYDEAKVKAIHQVYFVTNQLIDMDESQNEETMEVNDECLRQAVEEEDWEYVFQAYKARVYHDQTNPTNGMLKKNPELEDEWRPANQKEFQGMINNGLLTAISFETAKRVGITPHVTTRMTKRDMSKKTRISNDGRFEIRRGMFNNTSLHSPAMDEELMKILLHVKAYYNYKISQSDVTQAFTHNAMSEAEQPRRIVWYLEEVECGIHGGAYFELNAVSYGCADAGKEWYRHIGKHINSLGFQTSVYHPCLFYKRLPDETMILVGLATDNWLQIYADTELGDKERQKFQDGMSDK